MSIREEWLEHVEKGRLHRLDPFPGDRKARTVLLSDEVNALVSGPWEDETMEVRCARLRARLQRIVRGDRLVVCMEPFKARMAEIGRLDPIEHSTFDIRDSDKPNLRVFCKFAETDVIVASICAPRSVSVGWLPRLPLGFGTSRAWRRAITECQTSWTHLFPTHDPVKGDNLDEYLSNAVLERTRSRA